MRDIDYQLNKDKRPSINPAIIVLKCYHDFLDVFLKQTSNTVLAHLKHNHVIRLLGEKNHGQAVLRAMLKKKLAFVKKFLEDNLKKALLKQVMHPAPCQSCLQWNQNAVSDFA